MTVLRLELAERIDLIECDKCGTRYRRVYGAIYEDEQGFGIYSADLHAKAHDLRVLLAIGWLSACRIGMQSPASGPSYLAQSKYGPPMPNIRWPSWMPPHHHIEIVI